MVLYIVSLLESFRLMYSTGRSSPPIYWVRTSPSPRSDASVCSKKGREKSGECNSGWELLPLVTPGAASASPGSASPVRTAASLPGFSFPQEASTHKTPNKTLNAGQLVPKISGCQRWGLTAASTLCFCPRNWMAKRTTGYSATSPCTHLTRTMQLVSNASG